MLGACHGPIDDLAILIFTASVYSKQEKTVLAFLLVRLYMRTDGEIRLVRHGGYIPQSISTEESVSTSSSSLNSEHVQHNCMVTACVQVHEP